jgi:hypothetical protein
MAGQVSQNVEQTSTDPKTKKEAQVSKQIFIFLDNLTQKAAQIDYTFRRP